MATNKRYNTGHEQAYQPIVMEIKVCVSLSRFTHNGLDVKMNEVEVNCVLVDVM